MGKSNTLIIPHAEKKQVVNVVVYGIKCHFIVGALVGDSLSPSLSAPAATATNKF